MVLAAAPFPFGTEVTVGGRKLSSNTDRVHVVAQSFAMSDGTLRTNLTFEGWRLAVTQFVSRSDPTLACMRIEATPIDTAATVRQLSIAPKIVLPVYNATRGSGVPGEVVNDTTPVPNWTWDRCITISLRSDSGSRLGLTAKGITTNSTTDQAGIVYDLIVSSVAGDLYAPQDPMLAAYDAMEKGLYIGGFRELQRRNREAWSDIWRGRIAVTGTDFTLNDQLMLDTAFFYLQSNVHPNAKSGVPPYGLSQSGICYEGGT